MVSRETLISDALRQLGIPTDVVAVSKLVRFSEMLEEIAVPRGFLGPDEAERIAARHVLESAGLASFAFAEGSPTADWGSVIDVGSGAGLPGLVLACLGAEPVWLVEAQARRAAFLREAVHELAVAVEVVQSRAEIEGHGPMRESAKVVTARALAASAAALELTVPLSEVGGRVLIPMAEPGPEALRDAEAASEVLGGGPPELVGFEVPGMKERRWVMIVPKLRSTPEKYPRSAKTIKQHPLGRDVT
jgi:16S rRNA (guanine527-N7)-methyltransferase